MYQHRRDGKCFDAWLVKGTDYCAKCLCKVYGREFVKHRSDWCWTHKSVIGASPVPVQLAAIAADLAPALVPCDLTDFLQHYVEIRRDLALCIICTLVKEPTATRLLVESWQLLPAGHDAVALH